MKNNPFDDEEEEESFEDLFKTEYPLIGRGSYSRAYLMPGNRILRLSSYDAVEVDLINVIQAELAKETPFVPKVYTNFVVDRSELTEYYLQGMSEDSDEISVIVMEYASAKITPRDVKACTFCLLWMLYTSIKKYGFQHRDIKPANIVYKYNDEQFCFMLGKYERFHIPNLRIIPMLIDFDTAEIRDTHFKISFTREKNYVDGTYLYLAPEYLVSRVEYEQYIGCRDVYAIALSMLEVRLGGGMVYDADNTGLYRKYATEITKSAPELEEVPVYLFPEVYCFLQALHDDRDPPVHLKFWKKNQTLAEIAATQIPIYKKKLSVLSRDEIAFYSVALNWYPEGRVFGGDMHSYFNMRYFDEFSLEKTQPCEGTKLIADTKDIWAGRDRSIVIGSFLATLNCMTCAQEKATHLDDGVLKCEKCIHLK